MLQNGSANIRTTIASPWIWLRVAMVLALVLILSVVCFAQPKGGTGDFFHKIVGEWVGTCEQATDGQQAENKYFHAVIKQVGNDTFSAFFEYYRCDEKTGNPLHIGDSTVTTTVAPDGTAKSTLSGKGIIMVNKQPKNEQHDLTEVLNSTLCGLTGDGDGKINVGGMPLGLGKNGKIREDHSTWALNNGVLTISQSLRAGFRALFFTKSFLITARYTAHRGTSVASLITRSVRVSARPAGAACGR